MILVKNLSKSYKSKEIFNKVNLSINENTISFLMAPNGYGKTTFIKCLLGLEEKEGEILFNEKPLKEVREQIAIVYDDSPLYLNLTGLQNIQLMTQNCSLEDIKNMSNSLLSYEKLKKKTSKYSYGEKKKLSVIISFLKKAKYLFLDEISNGLDYETMMFLKQKLKDISKNSIVFLTGHQFEFYDGIVDDVFILKNKQIIQVKNNEIFINGGKNIEEIYKQNFKINEK